MTLEEEINMINPEENKLWHNSLLKHKKVLEKIQFDKHFEDAVNSAGKMLFSSVAKGGKIILFGNGGSAADAQHIASEFVGRFYLERHPIPAIALTANSSVVTAVSNDYSFENVFARQVEAFAGEKDAVIGITTGGSSENVLNALKKAKECGAFTIMLTGEKYDKNSADIIISVPSSDTPVIQEMHIMIGHFFAQYVEKKTDNLA